MPTVKSDERNSTIRISRHLANYVAATAASIILFFAFSTPVQNTHLNQPQSAGSNLFLPSHLMPSLQETPHIEPLAANEAQAEPTSKAPGEEISAPAQPRGGYAVVLASAISMKNANAFVEDLKAEGYNAEVYVKNDMVRVILPGYETAADVHRQIQQMKAKSRKYDKAWTLKIEP